MNSLRDKIARMMHDEFTGLIAHTWEREDLHEKSYWLTQADTVLAFIDVGEIRAEAWDEGYDYRTVEYRQYEEERVNPYRKADR